MLAHDTHPTEPSPRPTRKTTKMYPARGRGHASLDICLDPKTLDRVEDVKAAYREALGRDVSLSLLVRHAVALLADRLSKARELDILPYEANNVAKYIG